MKKSKGIIVTSLIISILSFILLIPVAFFLILLLSQHGKLYYVILFSLIALVLLISCLAFLFIFKLAKNNNKSLEYLEKNGIKIDNKISSEIQNETSSEESLEKEDSINDEAIEVLLEEKEVIEENNELNEISNEISDEIPNEESNEDSDEKHETIYKKIENKEDSFNSYLNKNEQIDSDVEKYYTEKKEQNQKKREQSIKNEDALKHVQRNIKFNDCFMDGKFLKNDVLTLNMDYIEEVKIDDNKLNFILFDINYCLEFDDNNKLLTFLSYLKNNK